MQMTASHRVGEVAELAVAVTMLQPENLESIWDDHALPLVIGRGNALKGPEPLQCSCSSLGLVGDHSAEHVAMLMPCKIHPYLPDMDLIFVSTTMSPW